MGVLRRTRRYAPDPSSIAAIATRVRYMYLRLGPISGVDKHKNCALSVESMKFLP